VITFCRDALRSIAAPCSAHAVHLSRRMDGQLSAGERVGLWVHMRGCSACRAFARQLEKLRVLARSEAASHPRPQTMPPDVRERLAAAVTHTAPDQGPLQ
jgi:predicted anti-sigma-YlaC factor YlaD